VERILIVRLSSMGDIIHALPAAAALRQARPSALIGWLVEERWMELLCSRQAAAASFPRCARKPLVDVVHAANLGAWRQAPFSDETWKETAALLREIRGAAYDSVFDLQGAVRSAVLAQFSGAANRIGSERPRELPASLFYTRRVPVSGRHVVEQACGIVSSIAGDRRPPPAAQLPVDPSCEAWCDALLQSRGVHSFALLCPGAGWGAKCWPPERYGQAARAMAVHGLRTLINAGPGEEGLAREVEAAAGGCGQTVVCSVGELIALTRRAKLFIGGDTGPLHLAAALQRPVVGIFGPTDPARNGPYGTASIVLRDPASATTHARRAQPDAGLLAIPAEAVISAARHLLGSAHA